MKDFQFQPISIPSPYIHTNILKKHSILSTEFPPESTQPDSNPPSYILTDYIELAYLVVLFLVGAPLNLAACSELHSKQHGRKTSRLDLLKKHLNYSDLMVMLVYAPSKICWLLTYSWRGGDAMCRVVKMAHSVTFQVSSNIIVAIACDRLFCVIWPVRHSQLAATLRTRVLVAVAWLLAIVLSVPQLFIWEAWSPFADQPEWVQCLSVWHVDRFKLILQREELASDNASAAAATENTTLISGVYYEWEYIYLIYHILIVFWLPCLMILLCYLFLSCWLWRTGKRYSSPASGKDWTSSASGQVSFMSPSQQQADSDTKPSSYSVVVLQSGNTPQRGRPNPKRTPVIDKQLVSKELLLSKTSNNASRSQQFYPSKPDIYIHDTSSNAAPYRRESSTSTTTATATAQSSSMVRMKTHAIRVSLLLVVAYIVCWTPYQTVSLWQILDPQGHERYSDAIYGIHGLLVLNSVLNPFLYGMFGKLSSFTRND